MSADMEHAAPLASDSPMLAEWLAIAELGKAEGEVDIEQAQEHFARIAYIKPENVYDLLAALFILKELGAILLEPAKYQLPLREIQRLGAVICCLGGNAEQFVQTCTETTLDGIGIPADQKH